MKPRRLHLLNPKQIESKSLKPGKYADGGGLYLIVEGPAKDGSPGPRKWIFRYSSGERRREMGLGSAAVVDLKAARAAAAAASELVGQGIDPKETRDAEEKAKAVAEVEAAPPVLFRDYALQVLEVRKIDWHGEKSEARWLNAIDRHCVSLAAVPIADINTEQVLGVLRPIWGTIPEMAQKTQGILEAVLDAAKAGGLRQGDNPARWLGHLNHLLPKRKRLTKGHHAAAAADQVPDLMPKLRKREGADARALELTILTGARTTEVRRAIWSEFDLETALWSIPRERVKERRALERAEKTHKAIPLAPQAVEMLRAWREAEGAWRDCEPEAFLFLGRKDGQGLGENKMSDVLDALGVDATVHGFRSTFRDWAASFRVKLRSGRSVPVYSWEAVEIQLGHSVGNRTQQAYFRGDLLDERRDLVRDWAEFCDGRDPMETEDETAEVQARFMAFLTSPGGAQAWAAFQAKAAA